jgi:diguanylate cyclase (GGDEF)-like protein
MAGIDRDRDAHTSQMALRRAAPPWLRVGLLALGTAGVVALIARGEAFWLCLPGSLMACTTARGRRGALVSAAIVVAAAATAVLIRVPAEAPAVGLAILVPGASAVVLIGLRERLERERDVMRDFALRDPLTGIANRRSLQMRAEYEIARHTRGRSSFAVVMLDLDGFKRLNDRFGHAAGDDLLRDVALALKRSLRAPDTVARFGGDEFCVLAPETDELGTDRLAMRIADAVNGLSAGPNDLRATLGIAVFPDDGQTVTELLDTADQRLIASKRERKRRQPTRLVA